MTTHKEIDLFSMTFPRSYWGDPQPLQTIHQRETVVWHPLCHSAMPDPTVPEFLTRPGLPNQCLISHPGWVAAMYGGEILLTREHTVAQHAGLAFGIGLPQKDVYEHAQTIEWLESGGRQASLNAERYPSTNLNLQSERKWPTAVDPDWTIGIVRVIAELTGMDAIKVDVGHATADEPQVYSFATSKTQEKIQLPDILSDSLDELRHATERAEDEGWPIPTPDCLERTERLLRKMFQIEPHPYWVYPTPDAEMVIDGGDNDLRIIVIVPHDGGVIYTYRATDNGEIRAVERAASDDLPDQAMTMILARMRGGRNQA